MANFESHRLRLRRVLARLLCGAAFVIAIARPAPAQQSAPQPTQGFAVERFYPSAPGGGWFVMDDIDIGGGLGGAVSLTSGYARNPLEVTSAGKTQQLALVSGESFVNLAAAITYGRFRWYLNLPVPLSVTGNSGTLGAYRLTAPSVSIGANPDTVSDPRIGFDTRLFGKPGSVLRLGAGAQLIFPSGSRADYVSDGRYRAMFRFLAAGDTGHFSYAGQFGLHVRPAEGSLPPGGPEGNELLFGAGAGRRFTVHSGWDAVVGPEFFGETAVHSNYSGQTGFEGLLTGRLEQTGGKPHLRFKLGIGHGVVQSFGAPQWRVLVGVELIGQRPATRASTP
jgi:hypothetical protein